MTADKERNGMQLPFVGLKRSQQQSSPRIGRLAPYRIRIPFVPEFFCMCNSKNRNIPCVHIGCLFCHTWKMQSLSETYLQPRAIPENFIVERIRWIIFLCLERGVAGVQGPFLVILLSEFDKFEFPKKNRPSP